MNAESNGRKEEKGRVKKMREERRLKGTGKGERRELGKEVGAEMKSVCSLHQHLQFPYHDCSHEAPILWMALSQRRVIKVFLSPFHPKDSSPGCQICRHFQL